LVKEQGENLADADKEALEAAIAKVRTAAEGEDAEAIKTAIGELETASHAMSEALYKNAGETASAAGETPEPAEAETAEADDDAIDAEFEVKS